ncbi:choice-of-anchor I family protein [Thioalkalivibrio sulfidiphilus]|uniref:choice-of-anchor I family protein n=1 Tax=Thioalkalivibrio sulfidiphilus TaxID=1033854 RepID=UPI003BB0B0CB
MSSSTLRKRLNPYVLALGLAAATPATLAATPFALSIQPIGTYASGIFDQSAAEIVAHDPKTQRLFVVNAFSGQVDVLDIREPSMPTLLFNIDPSAYGSVVNSVDVHKGLVVAVIEDAVRTNAGRAVFLDTDGNVLADVEVGALPDMVTFTPDGKRVLVANEGEPSDDYSIDPEGSVSIIDLPNDISTLSQAHVRTADFRKFNDAELDPSIRIFGPGATVAQDLEPEYITVSKDSKTAWVALQENNAIAVLDIEAGEFTDLRGLGFKDHLLAGNELDVSDRDGRINITNWPVLGIYQPDSIASYDYRGNTYIVTANEGDARDYTGYSEESRFRALTGSIPVCPDSERFNAFYASNEMGITNLTQLRDNANMGRLTVTAATGLREDGSCYEDIYAFGARSFSIWNSELELVYDSGSDYERITAEMFPENFNSNHRENSFETRSDDKGPEPEGVTVAKLWGRTYAFVGLERIGGVMIHDITDPYAPVFVQYFNNRDFSFAPGTPEAGDLGAEGLIVIEAEKSPIPGVPLLVVANEVSGTTTVFRIERERLVGRR